MTDPIGSGGTLFGTAPTITPPLTVDASAGLTPQTIIVKANSTNRNEDRALVVVTSTCTVTSITRAGGTATATCASGGTLSSIPGTSTICVWGATQAEYDGCFLASRVSAAPPQWTYAVSGTPATPATGASITAGLFAASIGSLSRPSADFSGAGFELTNGQNSGGTNPKMYCDTTVPGCGFASDATIVFSSGNAGNGYDVGLKRSGTGNAKVTNGSTGTGGLQAGGATGVYTYEVLGPNGEALDIGYSTELITLSTSGTTTDSAGNLLPANSTITSVACRVTTTIVGPTSWQIGDGSNSTRFASSNSTLTAGTTGVGLNQWQGGVSSNGLGPVQLSAAKLRLTAVGGTPSAGIVRCTTFWQQTTPPTQ